MGDNPHRVTFKTAAQNRAIWGAASRLGLDEDALRDVVESVTGQRRISALSLGEAAGVIDRLTELQNRRRKQKKRVGPVSSHLSDSQLRYLLDLRDKLGWDEWGLRRWLKKYFKTDNERWLSAREATKAIQALVEMRRREYDREHSAVHNGQRDGAEV